MLLQFGLLLLFLNCVRTTEYYDYGLENSAAEIDRRFSFWPSIHNGARLMKIRKREAQASAASETTANKNSSLVENANSAGANEGDTPKDSRQHQAGEQAATKLTPQQPPSTNDNSTNKQDTKVSEQQTVNKVENNTSLTNSTDKSHNVTSAAAPTQLDFNNPGVMKRGIIVFGGFLLLAVAYFIFYRRKSNKNDTTNSHNTNDGNQFRYGVLQSDDRRDNLELSRIPLTMESDEDEDEDLEIFDLEQKKKSLSYVNLQTNDEDVVFNNRQASSNGSDKDNLLLDIEDEATDTLINWSNNGNKSIL